jgi:hypothetical protein
VAYQSSNLSVQEEDRKQKTQHFKQKKEKKKKWPVDAQTCNRSHRKTSNLNKVKLDHGVQQQHMHTYMNAYDAFWMV